MPKRKAEFVDTRDNASYEASDDLFARVSDNEIMASKAIHLNESHTEDIAKMFMNPLYSDCILRVDGHLFPVNRSVLSVRSDYFGALLFGPMSPEDQTVIDVLNVRAQPFQHVLRFMYSSALMLDTLSIDMMVQIMEVSRYLLLMELFQRIVDHFKICVTIDNVFDIQKAAEEYSVPELIRVTNLFIDQNADQILSHKSFPSISCIQLIQMLRRDSFYVSFEENIVKGVCLWIQEKSDINVTLNDLDINDKTVSEIMSSIRFWNINKELFKQIIISFGMDYEFMLKIYEKYKKVAKPLRKHRYCLLLNQNVATNQMNTKVLKGRQRTKMISDSNRWYTEKMATSHSIGTNGNALIVVELSKPFLINHIVMVLLDLDFHSYSYFIQVSVDRKQWTTVVDYRNYLCRSYQYLFFESQTVRYIQINGTKAIDYHRKVVLSAFDVLHMECMYSTFRPQLSDGLIVKPKDNVFKSDCNGFKKSERKLLEVNQKYQKSEIIGGKVVTEETIPFNRGSICWSEEKCIYIQLSQPFIVNSMAFKFKDFNNIYSECKLCVQISINQTMSHEINDNKNWKDISNVDLLSIGGGNFVLNFIEETVVFIRICSLGKSLPELESFSCHFVDIPNGNKKVKY